MFGGIKHSPQKLVSTETTRKLRSGSKNKTSSSSEFDIEKITKVNSKSSSITEANKASVSRIVDEPIYDEVFETLNSGKNTPASPSTANSTYNLQTFGQKSIESSTQTTTLAVKSAVSSKEAASASTASTDPASLTTSQGRTNSDLILSNRNIVKMVGLSLADKMKITEFVRGIPCFSGKRDSLLEESLNIFLSESKTAFDIFDVDQKKYFLSVIKNRFRGDALVLVNNLKFENFEELQNFSYLHYIPRKDPSEVVSEINTTVQRVDESILAYSERLKGLVSLADTLLDQKYENRDISSYKSEIAKQAIRQFKFGIRDHTIQTALFHEKCESLDAATEMALKWEKIEMSRHNGNKTSLTTNGNNSDRQNNIDTDSILEKILETLNKQNLSSKSGNNGKVNNDFNRKAKFCEFCKIKGHSLSECRRNKFMSKNCDFCQRQGHSISECRIKKSTPFCMTCRQYYHTVETCPRNQNQNTFSKNKNSYLPPNTGNVSHFTNQQTGQTGYQMQNGVTYYKQPQQSYNSQPTKANYGNVKFKEPSNIRFVQQIENGESFYNQGNDEVAICSPQIASLSPE